MPLLLFSLFVLLFSSPLSAYAVLPPDIIFSVGAQLWQIVAGVVALLVGSLTSVFPFMKSGSVRMPRTRSAILLVGLVLIFSSLSYLLYLLMNRLPSSPIIIPPYTAGTIDYEFHSNRFVLLGTKANGEKIVINIDANRKEISKDEFIHYYMGGVINGASSALFNMQRTVQSHNILTDLFFTQFKRTTALDHSAREAYVFSFTSKGHEYHIETDLITSDFLIKNEPEYTAYIGTGKARGVVDGEAIDFNILIGRIYSTDYRPMIFFDPESEISSDTIELILWDRVGNFYLIDRSLVNDYSPAYASHFWGLIKRTDGNMLRLFSGDVEMKKNNGYVEFFSRFKDSGTPRDMTLRIKQLFDGKTEEGYVEGTITEPGGTEEISGLGYYHHYGPQ